MERSEKDVIGTRDRKPARPAAQKAPDAPCFVKTSGLPRDIEGRRRTRTSAPSPECCINIDTGFFRFDDPLYATE